MQLEASQVLLSLEESTHELRQEVNSARSFVAHAQEQAVHSLGLEEASLEEALKASTGLQRRASQKVDSVVTVVLFFILTFYFLYVVLLYNICAGSGGGGSRSRAR